MRLFLIFYIAISIPPTFFIGDAKIISRMNWGVVFHETANVLNGASVYYHTFAIPTPRFPELNLPRINCGNQSIVAQFIYCDAANELLDAVRQSGQDKIRHANTRLRTALDVLPDFNRAMMMMAGKRRRNKRDDNDITSDEMNTKRKRKTVEDEENKKKKKKKKEEKKDEDLYAYMLLSNDNEKPIRYGHRRLMKRDIQPMHCDEDSRGNFFDDLRSGIFGVATQSQVKVVANQICRINNVIGLNSQEIVQTNSRLSSLSQETNARLDNTASAITNLNERVQETRLSLQKLAQDMGLSLRSINAKINAEIRGTHIFLSLLSEIQKYDEEMDSIETKIDNFVEGINQLITGYLPPSLVPQTRLKRIITDIMLTLSKGGVVVGGGGNNNGENYSKNNNGSKSRSSSRSSSNTNDIALVETRPNFYYMINTIISTRADDKVYIMVPFPLRADGGGLMTLYRVEDIPITLNSTSQVTTRVVNVPDFLAISMDENYFSEYSATDIVMCKGDALLTCSSERSLRSINDPSCIMAIFANHGKHVNNVCDFAMEMKSLPSSATKIAPDLYYLHSSRVANEHNHDNRDDGVEKKTKTTIAPWLIKCLDLSGGGEETSHPITPCAGCTHRLPCGCALIATGEFSIPRRLCDASDIGLSNDEHEENDGDIHQRRYIINLPFANALYGDEYDIDFNGEHMFVREPEISFPIFQPFSEDFTAAIDRDKTFSMNMSSYIAAMEVENRVYSDKASAALGESKAFINKTLSDLEDQEKERDRLSWLTVLTPSTAEEAVIVGIALPIIAIILNIFVICKTKF
ncbi:hypothetical protein CAPTEDRAFT_187486 [Capitella teleta]|uniref:Uncharacterized protein n=1 Tax=Capitella teleta TaxID=283909 RepID=R7TNN5_CAPTE|nr:hypothetical protein CAPTEDRAFT_187486 [Capitella teleta]|eukprot:ELT95157.1 hypothetical protein CAPTEDRAFT_187486 [Capitella teleta]